MEKTLPLPRSAGLLLALLLLIVFGVELDLSIRNQSLSWDEGDHIYAGYQSWKAHDFGLNPEHPPFVKALATLPLLAMHLKDPMPRGLPFFKDEAYFDGHDLIFGNGGVTEANRILFRVRAAAATLSILMAALVFFAGREMFGELAGLFALALVVFEPNLIAHGAYVTTDMGVTCFMFATVYAFYRCMKKQSVGRDLILGLAFGLALASKHSAILLLPIGIALAVSELVFAARGLPRKQTALALGRTLAIGLSLALLILWSAYGFRFSAHPGGVSMTPSLAEYAKPLHGIEPRIYLLLARLHVLPESYLYGLTDVRLVSNTFPTFIFGKIHAHGVAYYFPAAFVIKSTAGFMLLMLLAAVLTLGRRLPMHRELSFLLLPPAIYLLIAMGTGLNIGARHILPMYPFLAVWIGGAVVALAKTRRWAGYVAVALLGWHCVSSARACPLYLAYSNEFFGGPANTYRYLTDSNVDWGQQLRDVKTYVDRRGIKDCSFAYFVEPYVEATDYGIPCKALPTADSGWAHTQIDTPSTITGTVFISAGTLTGYEYGSRVLNPYQSFVTLKPTAVIDDGVFVYDGTFDMRFAEALGHVTRSTTLFTAGKKEAALAEAQTAVRIDPDELQAQMALGDAATALDHKPEALAAYQQATVIAGTMEPSAKVDWLATIAGKMPK